MIDDYHRVFIRIDGEEKPIMISTTDLKVGLQSIWLSDMDRGWSLLEARLEQRLPNLIAEGMEKREMEKARALEKATAEYLERHPPQPVNPLKAFISRNWAWVTTIVVLVIWLKPELAGHALAFLF